MLKQVNALDPLIVHPLSAAPTFLGRDRELERLNQHIEGQGVVALIGIGGSGKTVTVERFLSQVIENKAFDALIVWSFYDDPDTNAFLKAAVEYLAGDSNPKQGSGWFQALKQALDARPRTLIVLDGLERVQRTVTNSTGVFGELEDPLLKALLVRLADGQSGAKAIVTSRFHIADLENRTGVGYETIDVDALPRPAARELLKSHGIEAEDAELDYLLNSFGCHALTVDVLGAAVARFFDGRTSQVQIPSISEGTDQRAIRLAEVLKIFESHLTLRERDMMSRLCVFRFGVSIETVSDIFLNSGHSVGGSLAGLSTNELEEIAEQLANLHLVHREAHNRYSVHPAIRDYFYSAFRESASSHGAISKHLLSLTNRPGVGLPTSKEALDLLEELVYHALRSGNYDQALEIYMYRLGGNDHLNTALGEYARTYRILRAFEEPPDQSGMYHCLRAFGDFNGALTWRPQNRYIQLALGRLPALKDDESEATRAVARFLMGERINLPDRTPDFPIPVGWLLVLAGRIDEAIQRARNEIQQSLYGDDIARNRAVLISALLRQGKNRDADKVLQELSQWVLRSGSQEHLCVFYILTGRTARLNEDFRASENALNEALQLATEASFDLFAVDVLAEQAALRLAQGSPALALERSEMALRMASNSDMRYAWGEAEALNLLLRSDPMADERFLPRLIELQKRIGHPELSNTQKRSSMRHGG